jgi:2-oxoglutarate ferredoxin oxidoreductase subunit delta
LKKGFIRIDRELCKGCGLCIAACPKGSIRISNKLNTKSYHPAEYSESEKSGNRKCTGCTLCAITCPDIAIEVFRG